MNLKQIKFICPLFILVSLSINVGAQQQNAAAAARAFYKFHLARSDVFKTSEVKAYQKWFTNDLNQLFQTELQREKEYLKKNPTDKPHFGDGFPFQSLDECESAGKLIKNTYTVGAATTKDRRATVEVKFFQPKQCGGELIEVCKVKLVNSSGKWLIDDWLYSDGGTLSGDLKRAEY